MATETEIANLALSHLGMGKTITDLDTERSQEAATCRAFYAQARDEMLREFIWPFANRIVTLGLITAAPNTRWGYSYRYPSDCAMASQINNGSRIQSHATRIPFEISSDSSGWIIYTDQANAELSYGAKITDTGLFAADFVMALSLRLASYASARLTAGDPFKRGEVARQLYVLSVTKAQVTAINEEQSDQESDGDLITARG